MNLPTMFLAEIAVNSPGAVGWLWVVALIVWTVRNVLDILGRIPHR